jgi:hypothetical protein
MAKRAPGWERGNTSQTAWGQGLTRAPSAGWGAGQVAARRLAVCPAPSTTGSAPTAAPTKRTTRCAAKGGTAGVLCWRAYPKPFLDGLDKTAIPRKVSALHPQEKGPVANIFDKRAILYGKKGIFVNPYYREQGISLLFPVPCFTRRGHFSCSTSLEV